MRRLCVLLAIAAALTAGSAFASAPEEVSPAPMESGPSCGCASCAKGGSHFTGGCRSCQHCSHCGGLLHDGVCHACGGSDGNSSEGSGDGEQGGCGPGGCGHGGKHGGDKFFNCNCHGSYKFPVPPLYTYHWPGLYSMQRMTDYHSPWRFPAIKPYQDETPVRDLQSQNPGVRQASGDYYTDGNEPLSLEEPISAKFSRQYEQR